MTKANYEYILIQSSYTFVAIADKFAHILEILDSHTQQTSVSEELSKEDAIRQLLSNSLKTFNATQRAMKDIKISSTPPQTHNIAFETIISTAEISTSQNLQAEQKRVIIAMGDVIFQLKSLRGHEGKLLILASATRSAESKTPLQLIKELHIKCAELARVVKDEPNYGKFMKSFADALNTHLHIFSKEVFPLIK